MTLLLAWFGPEASPLPGPDLGSAVRSLFAVFVVLGLIAACAWLVRRGTFGALGRRGPQAVRIETAVALGDRRSLMVVAVEGRRLLLGVTPQHVSLVTELDRAAAFEQSLSRATAGRSAAEGQS